MSQSGNRRQKEAKKKLEQIYVFSLLMSVFCLVVFGGYIYPRYSKEKRLREEEAAAEMEKQRLAEEARQEVRRRIEQQQRKDDFLKNFPEGTWISEPFELRKFGKGRVFIGKESPSAPISATMVFMEFIDGSTDALNLKKTKNFLRINVILSQKSIDTSEAVRKFSILSNYSMNNKETQKDTIKYLDSEELSIYFNPESNELSAKLDIKIIEWNIIRFNIRIFDDNYLNYSINEWIKREKIEGEDDQEKIWRQEIRGLIARNFDPLPSNAPPPAELLADGPSPAPPVVNSSSEKKPAIPPKTETVESPKTSLVPPKAAVVLTAEDAVAAAVNYLGLACSETGNADDASEMFIKDKDIWYYDAFKSHTAMVEESKDWDVKNPYQRFDVNGDSARCTETNNVFDVSLKFTARVGQNEAAAPIKQKKGFFRLEERNGVLRISRISTCGENESEPFPGWVVAKYRARISRQDVSQKGGTLFSSLKFDNEAALFREIILQDRVNYLSGKGDAEDEPSGWFDPEGRRAAKLIEKRREQLGGMRTFYSGPKDRFFAGSTSAVVEVRHKEQLSVTILPDVIQGKGPGSGF